MRTDLVKNEKGKFRLPSLEGIEDYCNSNYQQYYKYYSNAPTDLTELWKQRTAQGVNPNNFAPSGYPKYIIDIMAGYMGSPNKINYSSDDEDYMKLIDAINKANHENTLSSKEIKKAGIYGTSCELHFIQKKGNNIIIPRFIDIDPSHVIPVYDTTVSKELIAVVWVNNDTLRVYYIDETEIYIKGENGTWVYSKSEPNPYNDISWVFAQNNDESEPTWFCVKTYVDIINALQTNTLNALDRHARGTLITSLEQTQELVNSLSELNAIFGLSKGDDSEGKDFFEFVQQNLDPDLREAMLNYFVNELHKLSGIFDFTKLDLGQDPSGTALKYRIYPMELKASEIVSYRYEALEKRYELVNQIIDSTGAMGDTKTKSGKLKISIQRNIPDNIKAILEENNLMASYVDTQTLRERVPELDANKVQERMEEENAKKVDLDGLQTE